MLHDFCLRIYLRQLERSFAQLYDESEGKEDDIVKRQHWWQTPSLLAWTQLLLNSYCHWTGKDLIDRGGTEMDQSERLFFAPFVVVSHDSQSDPHLNYGNHRALALWEMDWEKLRNTPSRLTAEPMNRAERARMLEQAANRGFITDYRGIRISRTGRRFLVEQATVWNVLDATSTPCGQAAMFSNWTQMPIGEPERDPLCNS